MLININISFTQVALLTMLSLFTASPTHAADLLDFRALHAQYVNQYTNDMENQSLSGHPTMGYYYFSYYLHGMLSGVEKTQDEAMLQKVIHYIDNMLSKTTVKAGHNVWGPFESSSGRPIQLYFYKACTPIARAAAVIMQNPTFREKYGSAATRYINFLDDSFIQYYYVETFGKKIPFLDKDLGGINTSGSWSGKASLFGETATSLYVATKDARTARTPMYLDIATRVATGFKRRLQPKGSGWVWDEGLVAISDNYAKTPDTQHANTEARLLVLNYEAGVVFTLNDVQKMANTLSDNIWNGSTSNPLFSNYINGSNSQYRTRTQAGQNGAVYAGWALLGKYSTKAQMAVSYLLKAIVDGKKNPSIGYNATRGGKIALSGHLLRNSSTAPILSPSSNVPTPVAPKDLAVAP
jgi:hypothetical protein